MRFFFVFQPIGLFQLFRGSFIGSTSAAARQLARFSRRPYMSFFCDITGFFYRVFRSQHPRSQFGIFWAKPSSWRGNSFSEFSFYFNLTTLSSILPSFIGRDLTGFLRVFGESREAAAAAVVGFLADFLVFFCL